MSMKRKVHNASFKAKVALAALRAEKTCSQLTSEYGVSSGQISTWKKELVQSAPSLFEKGRGSRAEDPERIKAPLYEEIGRLKMELDWLKKKAEWFRD